MSENSSRYRTGPRGEDHPMAFTIARLMERAAANRDHINDEDMRRMVESPRLIVRKECLEARRLDAYGVSLTPGVEISDLAVDAAGEPYLAVADGGLSYLYHRGKTDKKFLVHNVNEDERLTILGFNSDGLPITLLATPTRSSSEDQTPGAMAPGIGKHARIFAGNTLIHEFDDFTGASVVDPNHRLYICEVVNAKLYGITCNGEHVRTTERPYFSFHRRGGDVIGRWWDDRVNPPVYKQGPILDESQIEDADYDCLVSVVEDGKTEYMYLEGEPTPGHPLPKAQRFSSGAWKRENNISVRLATAFNATHGSLIAYVAPAPRDKRRFETWVLDGEVLQPFERVSAAFRLVGHVEPKWCYYGVLYDHLFLMEFPLHRFDKH